MMAKLSNFFKKIGSLFTGAGRWVKSHRALVVIIALITVVYSFILACTGVFGESVHDKCFSFIKNVLPYIGIAVGYFFAIFLPVRIVMALERNARIKEEQEKEMRLSQRVVDNKKLQENILNLLNKEDTL